MAKQQLIIDILEEIQSLEKKLFNEMQILAGLKLKIRQLEQEILNEKTVEKENRNQAIEIIKKVYTSKSSDTLKQTDQPIEKKKKSDKEEIKQPTEVTDFESTRMDRQSEPYNVEPAKTLLESTKTTAEAKSDIITKNTSLNSNKISFNDSIGNKQVSDFNKAFSLNDRFRFSKELFSNSIADLNNAIADLNKKTTLDESILYLENELGWDIKNKAFSEFITLLKKRFS